MATAEYQRLTRTRARGMFAVAAITRSSLWLGADHLLLINTNGYTETYKRFYFRDIQAFVMQRNAVATIVNIVLAIPFVLLLACAFVSETTGVKILLFSIAGLLAVIALINVVQGQTCHCFLRTAVQEEQLPPLNRVRRAEKIISRLRPLIAAAQGGELSPPMVSELMREPVQFATDSAPVVTGDPDLAPRLES